MKQFAKPRKGGCKTCNQGKERLQGKRKDKNDINYPKEEGGAPGFLGSARKKLSLWGRWEGLKNGLIDGRKGANRKKQPRLSGGVWRHDVLGFVI